MNQETLLVYLPIFLLFIGLAVWELRTELIPNKALLPAFLYVAAIRLFIGPASFGSYFYGALFMLIVFAGLTTIGFSAGGAKLLTVTGLAVGISHAIWITAILLGLFFLVYVLCKVLNRSSKIPTSPLIFLATLVELVRSGHT